MKQSVLLLLTLLVLSSCKNSTKQQAKPTETTAISSAQSAAQDIAKAHHIKRFKVNKAISFQLKVKFAKDSSFAAKVSLNTKLDKIRVELHQGTVLIYDGKSTGIFPKSNAYPQAASDLWTWANLFALPFEVEQYAHDWKTQTPDSIDAKSYKRLAINFSENPIWPNQQWTTLYTSPSTGFLHLATYKSAAPQHPTRAVIYDNYFSLHGVPIAKQWKIYSWDTQKNQRGQKLAEVEISQVRFFLPSKDYFKIQPQSLPVD